MTTFADRYAAGVKAFSVLTGELDKAALKDAVRDGFAALLEWSEKTSGRDIAKTSGRSVNQVARDIRAARFMADHPKADPVATVKACNILTAGEVAKADGPKALAEAYKAKSGETAKGRKARGSVDVTDKSGKGPKRGPVTVKELNPANLLEWLDRHCTWTAEDADKVSTAFAVYAQNRRKTDAAVAKTA